MVKTELWAVIFFEGFPNTAGNASASDSESSEESETEENVSKAPNTSLFSNFKRSAPTSPEENSAKKNEKKKKRKNPESVAVRSSSRHGGQNLSK